MDATIDGEKDGYLKIYVTDNYGVQHDITVDITSDDGEVAYHDAAEYANDPHKRTPDESAAVAEARRYARLYIYQETEYEPFPVRENLPGIERVMAAIDDLPAETFVEYFADLYKMVTLRGSDIDPPVALPPEAQGDQFVLFMVDVYLDDDGTIEAVSDIHLRYYDEEKTERDQWNDDPFPDRKPDARLQVTGDFVPTMEAFQAYLIYDLKCQIRDVYIGAGVDPPEEYRILGRGQYRISRRYVNDDISHYDRYHLSHADIPGYSFEFDYGMGEIGRTSAMLGSARNLGDLELSSDELFTTLVEQVLRGDVATDDDTDATEESSDS